MTAIPKNLETLTFKDLSALQTKIEQAQVRKYEEATTQLKAKQAELAGKLAKMAADLGVPVPEAHINQPTSNGHRKTRGKAKVAVKYRDPQHPENTWSGRGRMAGWLAAKVKQGAKADQFKVT